jgi:hypothetical protein
MALGVAAGFPWIDSTIHYGNGTSFASPILCGLAACLWEAHPEATSAEVRDAIVESAHLFTAPNDSMGYGIPNFAVADALLEANAVGEISDSADSDAAARVFPQPAKDYLQVTGEWAVTGERRIWRLYSRNGSWVEEGTFEGSTVEIVFGSPLVSGTYILTIVDSSTGRLLDALPVVFVND